MGNEDKECGFGREILPEATQDEVKQKVPQGEQPGTQGTDAPRGGGEQVEAQMPHHGQPGARNDSYGQEVWGQPHYGQPGAQSYGQAVYGQANSGVGAMPSEENGGPLKNHFGMKITFSILEILSICTCNVITMVLGILGCVFTAKADMSYKEGRVHDFKSQAKTATICLWVGFGVGIVWLIFYIFVMLVNNSFLRDTPKGGIYVYVDDKRIDVPTDYGTLKDLGFSFAEPKQEELDAYGDFGLYQMENAHGQEVMWCWFQNNSSSDAMPEDCDVIGVDVDYYCHNYEDYRTQEGLGFGSSKADFINTYGEPDDRTQEGHAEQLRWYLDGGSNPVLRVIDVTFDGDQLYDIDIDYGN